MMLMSDVTGISCEGGPWKRRHRPFNPPHVVSPKAFSRNKVKARHRLHKAFLHWFAENRHRFTLELKIEKRLDDWIEFTFVGIDPAIRACLSAHNQEMEVRFEPKGTEWDFIGEFWAWASPVPGGYIDTSLLDNCRQLRPSRKAIWEHGIFEEFLTWVNDTLAHAHWAELTGEPGRWSRARLIMTPEADDPGGDDTVKPYGYRVLVPCRVPA